MTPLRTATAAVPATGAPSAGGSVLQYGLEAALAEQRFDDVLGLVAAGADIEQPLLAGGPLERSGVLCPPYGAIGVDGGQAPTLAGWIAISEWQPGPLIRVRAQEALFARLTSLPERSPSGRWQRWPEAGEVWHGLAPLPFTDVFSAAFLSRASLHDGSGLGRYERLADRFLSWVDTGAPAVVARLNALVDCVLTQRAGDGLVALLEHGRQGGSQPGEALHFVALAASHHGDMRCAEIVRNLNLNGHSPDSPDVRRLNREPRTPLMLALVAEQWETAAALIDRGADLQAKRGTHTVDSCAGSDAGRALVRSARARQAAAGTLASVSPAVR